MQIMIDEWNILPLTLHLTFFDQAHIPDSCDQVKSV